MNLRLHQSALSLGIALCLVSAAGPAVAAWRPVAPSGDRPQRIVLEGDERRIHTWLAPGDTLRFDIPWAGRVRIETIPVYPSMDAEGIFRYGITLPGAEEVQWRRRSAPESLARVVDPLTTPGELEGEFVTGERDRLEVESFVGELRVRGKDSAATGLLVRVLRLRPREGDSPLLEASSSRARRRSYEGGFRLGAGQLGWDSNPFRAATNDVNPGSEFFYPLSIDLFGRWRASRTFRVDADYDFDGRFYGNQLLDETRNTFRLEQSWTSREGTWWRVRADQRVRFRDNSFFGRGDTEEFETIDDDGQIVPLGDRFDYTELRIRARGEVRVGQATELSVGGHWRPRDYRKDFGDNPGVYSLDYTSTLVTAGAAWRPDSPFEVSIRGELDWRDYEEKFPRDENGDQVPTAASELLRSEISSEVGYSTPGLADFVVGFDVFRSEDQFQGYWDYAGWRVSAEAIKNWARGRLARVKLSRKEWSYERAHVGFDPTAPLREKGSWLVDVDGRYRVTRWLDLEGELDYDIREDNDARFDYRRLTVRAGATLRW